VFVARLEKVSMADSAISSSTCCATAALAFPEEPLFHPAFACVDGRPSQSEFKVVPSLVLRVSFVSTAAGTVEATCREALGVGSG
jgi:hypothetical protein